MSTGKEILAFSGGETLFYFELASLMEKRPFITVMADFGVGPWAWLNESGDRKNGVGGNVADAAGGCSIESVSLDEDLENAFAQWAIFFEKHYDSHDFDWDAFNQEGLRLAKRLHEVVKEKFDVFYEKPCEDPNFKVDERTMVT